MKYKELHVRFVKAGWKYHYVVGNHYIYKKDGKFSEPIPYHGTKEIEKGVANKLIKKYGG